MTLTKRQREVVALLAQGMSYPEIGRALGIARETVRAHARTIALQCPGDDPMQRRIKRCAVQLLTPKAA